MIDAGFVTCDRLDLTKRTIESFLATAKDYRLFLWDNCSKDGTQEYLRTIPNRPWYAESNINFGADYAKDIMVKAMESEIVVLSDNDVIFKPNWEDKVIQAFDTFPHLGCLGFWSHPWHRLRYKLTRLGQTIHVMDYSSGCCLAFRRDAYLEVSGMGDYHDTPELWASQGSGYFIGPGDTLLQDKLRKNGWITAWLGENLCDHIGYISTTGWEMSGLADVKKFYGIA